MLNIQGIMKQAQAMQKKMEDMQERLAQQEVTGVSGGGMVKVTMSGKFEMKKVEIDKSLIVADEADILEDLIVAASNDAKNKVEAMMGLRALWAWARPCLYSSSPASSAALAAAESVPWAARASSPALSPANWAPASGEACSSMAISSSAPWSEPSPAGSPSCPASAARAALP